jgi:hypothetical protein
LTTETVTFNSLSSPNRPLNGQHPFLTIDWGTGGWWLSGPNAGFSGNSVSFNGPLPRSAAFDFVLPRRLIALDAYNDGTTPSTISVACPGLPTRQVSLPAHRRTTISTGWVDTCQTVTISSSNGWYTNFNNLVIDLGLPL